MSITLNIKLGAKAAIPVEVDRLDRVHHVKQRVCKSHNIDLDTNHLTILFQGKELRDDETFQESDLCDFSVLHAVVSPTEHRDTTGSVPSSVDSGIVVNQHEQGDAPQNSRCMMYYVYCKSPCHRIQPGRLRTRCAVCKQGTLKMNREPSGWEDVLHRGQIGGQCLNEGCSGNTVEFYFKCNGHSSEEDESCVVLYQIVANVHQYPCLTCTDTVFPVLVFSCETSHVMCLPCFEEYCTSRLNDRAFAYSNEHGYSLGCPAGCADSMIAESHHFKVLGQQQYDRYQRFAAEECVLHEGGVMCPAPHCGEGLFPGDVRRVQCVREGCLFVFCRECHREYHEGPCDLNGNQHNTTGRCFVRQNSQEYASLNTIATTTKPCPKCRVPVEKSGGCMHMVCSRCEFNWCWVCAAEWSRDCQAEHWFG